MKKIALLLLALAISKAFSQGTANKLVVGVEFTQGKWELILAKAKKERKLIFLDAYASWCGPCKRMKHQTFQDKKVAEYFNANFINVAIDMEKGEGIMLSEKYAIDSYPTLLFIKPDGSILRKTVGFHTPEELIVIGKKASKAKNKF